MSRGVRHIELDDDVTYTPQQLTTLIRSMAPSAGLDTLTLQCSPEGVTDPAIFIPPVGNIGIRGCEVNMSDIISLMRHLKVEHIIKMDDVTLHVDGKVISCLRLFELKNPLFEKMNTLFMYIIVTLLTGWRAL